jgi:nitrate reductase NapE component
MFIVVLSWLLATPTRQAEFEFYLFIAYHCLFPIMALQLVPTNSRIQRFLYVRYMFYKIVEMVR